MQGIDVMESMKGLQEVRDRIQLMQFFKKYAKNGDIQLDPAVSPWCAVMVNACERAAGKPGTGMQNARSFLKYGSEVKLRDGKRGDIVVFQRGNSPWQGHVAYLADVLNDGSLVIIGGNQNDKVCEERRGADGLLGVRRS